MSQRKRPSNKRLEDLRPLQQEPVRQTHDPLEVRIYINQLKKALKFLPLGSRAYYYVSGELVRSGVELKGSETENKGPSQRNSNTGSSRNER